MTTIRSIVLFDAGGPLDLEFGWEMAMDSAIAAACGLEGVRVDQPAVEEASEQAVAAFAADVYGHMIETLCGGDPATVDRVRRRVHAITGSLDLFQLRPDIDGLLARLADRGFKLGVVDRDPAGVRRRLARAGIDRFFGEAQPDAAAAAAALAAAPAACIMVGDRLDRDIAPARALGMATIQFRSGRHRRQRPRSPAEEPDAVVTDVPELEAAIEALAGRATTFV